MIVQGGAQLGFVQFIVSDSRYNRASCVSQYSVFLFGSDAQNKKEPKKGRKSKRVPCEIGRGSQLDQLVFALSMQIRQGGAHLDLDFRDNNKPLRV